MLNPDIQSNSMELPSCQSCGRQDETLRLAAYPFVVSVVFMTFQRQFSGLWCSRHRIGYWLQAALITSIIGWLGFPFGLLFAPFRLFQLLGGGIQPAETNSELLRRLGEKKIQEGNSAVAIKCLEASLQYMDSPEVRERLQRLYAMRPREEAPNRLKRYFLYLGVIIAFSILGQLAGVADYLLSYFVGGIVTSTNLILVILLWTPTVTMIFLSISLLRCVLEWVARFTQQSSVFPLLVVGISTLLFFIYNVMTGESFADFLVFVIGGEGYDSQVDTIVSAVLIFFLGGVDYVYYLFAVGQTWAIIQGGILLVSLVAGIVTLWRKAYGWAKWQTLLRSLQGSQWNRNVEF